VSVDDKKTRGTRKRGEYGVPAGQTIRQRVVGAGVNRGRVRCSFLNRGRVRCSLVSFCSIRDEFVAYSLLVTEPV